MLVLCKSEHTLGSLTANTINIKATKNISETKVVMLMYKHKYLTHTSDLGILFFELFIWFLWSFLSFTWIIFKNKHFYCDQVHTHSNKLSLFLTASICFFSGTSTHQTESRTEYDRTETLSFGPKIWVPSNSPIPTQIIMYYVPILGTHWFLCKRLIPSFNIKFLEKKVWLSEWRMFNGRSVPCLGWKFVHIQMTSHITMATSLVIHLTYLWLTMTWRISSTTWLVSPKKGSR
jgi:hypothetical protein